MQHAEGNCSQGGIRVGGTAADLRVTKSHMLFGFEQATHQV